jgi:hypothetical protein
MSLAGGLAWAAIALVVLGAIVRVAEARVGHRVHGLRARPLSRGGPGIDSLSRRKGRQLSHEALQAPGRSDRDHLARGSSVWG